MCNLSPVSTMNERERLICETQEYFSKFGPVFAYNIHEGNVDEMKEIMNKEIAERLKEYGGNPVVPLAPVGNDRPFRIDLKDPAWIDDLERQKAERKLPGGVTEILD